MVSEASWQTGGLSGRGAEPSAEGPMDQQSVETLLRRLVQRVEESERRYSEALHDLHGRLDQLSRTTGTAQASGAFEDAETFDRLHDQVSSLARRLEREGTTPLDDFERLGRALSGELEAAAALAGTTSAKPDLLSELAASSFRPSEPSVAAQPQPFPLPADDRDLDKRLVEMAHRLEHSINTSLPATALEALSSRLDEISRQIAEALEKDGKGLSLDPVERKLSDMAEQLGRAEAELAKIGKIETVLNQLIERVDGSAARMEEVAIKAAGDAAKRVAEEAKLNAGTAERLDAMHRDLKAMSERTQSTDDRLSGTIEAVHESLKKLVQLAEQKAASPAPEPKPRLPLAERMRRLDQPQASAQAAPEKASEAAGGSFRNRLAASIPEFQEGDEAPNFGRAKRGLKEKKEKEEKAPLDKASKPRTLAKTEDASYEVPDDLVAAARRAAQAAALKVEERGTGPRPRRLPGDSEALTVAETSGRRGRSFLMIFAVILLVISALLLYSRLRTKPEPVVMPPAAEQSAPLPPESQDPLQEESAPAAGEPDAAPSAPPEDASELDLEIEASPSGDAVGESGEPSNFTDVAKSPYRSGSAEGTVPVRPASLENVEAPALPPGVVFSTENPAVGQPMAALSPLPQSLPLPPEDLGPLPLRQAAATGDPRAQYAVALRYAQGQGTPQNLTEAARWLERAAGAGLAPAQYRLGAMYERGQGVVKDLGRARSWYEAAAEKGNVKAMHNLAVSLSNRESGTPDYDRAAKWYEQAASYGLADSQYNLGILAEHGLGVPKDLARAYTWFMLAAEAGDAEAAKRSGQLKLRLDQAALAEADKHVAAWTSKEPLSEANEVPEPAEWAAATPDSGDSLVTRAQTLLNRLGYDAGTPDGMMGARTREAIKSFERKNGLEETGDVTVPLVSKLERMAG